LRWRRCCTPHIAEASGNQLGASAVLYGTVLGSFTDPSSEFPVHLSIRTRKDSELADARIALALKTSVRIADAENEGLPRQDVFGCRLHRRCGRDGLRGCRRRRK